MKLKLAQLHEEFNKHELAYVGKYDEHSSFQVARCTGCGLVLYRAKLYSCGPGPWQPLNRDSCEQYARWYPEEAAYWNDLAKDCMC